MADRTEIDVDKFRRALSCFATGVAVVTTLDEQGEKVGITVSSFNSVSLQPPLILWSVGVDSMSYDVFTNAKYFAVHVLALDQQELSDRFAQSGNNKFATLGCGEGMHGVPILPEFAACMECSTEYVYAGGDHKIIVGRVHRCEDREADPLIIHRSRFLRKERPD
ncbi:MAG: flavin reductase family protein [Woeseia sp.]|nr:flavin reductase family protein [Woeseia sp.]